MKKRKIVFIGVVGIGGFVFQLALQFVMGLYAKDGFSYQDPWSSETMMQTVSIEDLRDEPLQSLFNIHAEPPGLDAIRAILATIWASQDSNSLLLKVDRSLYVLWAVSCGIMGALIFSWLSRTTQVGYAIIGALFFVVHPASILYATWLETTLLSSTLILWTYYLLWKIRHNPHRSIAAFTVAVLALFFTRSLFQWPCILIFSFSLIVFRVPYRRVAIFLLVCGGLTCLYLGKQYYKFGMLSTFGPAGLNLCRAIGASEYYNMKYYWNYIHISGTQNSGEQEHSFPIVLVRKMKLTETPNFNHFSYIRLDQEIMDYCKERLYRTPLKQLIASFLNNASIYLRPSSQYTSHVIVDHIPWRRFYDRIFSFPVLTILLMFAGLSWIARTRGRDVPTGLALALPAVYICLASVLGEKGENMRLKFLLEPVLFVFIASQTYVIIEHMYQRVLTKRPT